MPENTCTVYERKDGNVFEIPEHLQPKIAKDRDFTVAWFQYADSSGGFFFNKVNGKADAYYCDDPIYLDFKIWARSEEIRWFSL